MGQKIEGNLELEIELKGSRGRLCVDSVTYEGNVISFFKEDFEVLSLNLNKPYKNIYDALKALGIKAEGY
jgi:hypothetical protein